MRARQAQWAALLLSCISLAMADQAELSDEFLEYLGSLEGDADSWQDLASKPPAAPPKAASSSSASSHSSQRAIDVGAAKVKVEVE